VWRLFRVVIQFSLAVYRNLIKNNFAFFWLHFHATKFSVRSHSNAPLKFFQVHQTRNLYITVHRFNSIFGHFVISYLNNLNKEFQFRPLLISILLVHPLNLVLKESKNMNCFAGWISHFKTQQRQFELEFFKKDFLSILDKKLWCTPDWWLLILYPPPFNPEAKTGN